MANGSNPELEAVLKLHRQHQKKRAKRYVTVFWVLAADYHDTEEEACATLRALPAGQRAAIVDRDTGDTWAARQSFQPAMEMLRNQEHTAPRQFRRHGPLGSLKRPLGRRHM